MTYRTVELIQGSQDWLDFRKGKYGASMIAAIIGVSPYQTALELWEEIVFEKQKPKTRAMERGIELESQARDLLNRDYGLNMQPAVLQSIQHPDFIASMDAFQIVDGKPRHAEIKCPGVADHSEALRGKVPDHYFPQLQWQMYLAGTSETLYVSHAWEEESYAYKNLYIPVKRDDSYINQAVRIVLGFAASIIDFVPPEPRDRDVRSIDDPGLVGIADRLLLIEDQLKSLEKERDELRLQLTGAIDHPRALIGYLRMSKVLRKGNVDYSKMLEAIDEKYSHLLGENHKMAVTMDADSFRKPHISSWRFSEAKS